MDIQGFDHIVLCVKDVQETLAFYERVLGMEAREHPEGKFALHFGSNKISIQDAASKPALAEKTVPGSGNFCVLTEMPVEQVVARLRSEGVEPVEGPARKHGAVGDLLSVYFRDPDGNLVEVSNRLTS